jgi:polyhydroxyalkanoate synthesis regulator phasin
MSDFLGKTLNLGLGLFTVSRERIEEFVDEMVNKGEVAAKDARTFAGELVKRGEEQREDLKKTIRSEVARALDSAGLARKADLITKDDVRELIREALAERERPKE